MVSIKHLIFLSLAFGLPIADLAAGGIEKNTLLKREDEEEPPAYGNNDDDWVVVEKLQKCTDRTPLLEDCE